MLAFPAAEGGLGDSPAGSDDRAFDHGLSVPGELQGAPGTARGGWVENLQMCSGLKRGYTSFSIMVGVTFKKSVAKSVAELEFVPVNLHIQEMKVTVEGSDNKGRPALTAVVCGGLNTPLPADKVVFTAVTVGCPTAYSLKYKQGGLARMQVSSSLSSVG